MTFGQRLKELREAKGWSRWELSQRCDGIWDNAITRMEEGKDDPRLSTLRILAAVFEVNLDAFNYPVREGEAVKLKEDTVRFANKLRELRLAKGLSMIDLAHKIGYASAGNIARWESGKVNPSPTALQTLARALKVSVAELTG